MKKIVLPKDAFPHDKTHRIGLHTFTDGAIVVSDEDAARVGPMMKSFYGAEVLDVQEAAVEEPEGSPSEADLTAKQTKTGAKA